MTIQDIALFQGLGAKMDYLSQRQTVLAENVANSDTPGYRAKDLEEVDFSSILRTRSGGANKVSMAATDAGHLGGAKGVSGGDMRSVKVEEIRDPYEVSPGENSVVIEEQLMDASKNSMDYTLMLNVYKKQVGMFQTALGKDR